MSPVERWAPWWALIVVPLAFLGNQSAAYAIVAFACRSQHHALVHVFPALDARRGPARRRAVRLVHDARQRRDPRRAPLPRAGRASPSPRSFVLATLAQWYVAAALSPCLQ